VAAPIRAGLLPHNEFGLRFWDALFGSVAFLYVFAIGSLLAGPICGAMAVLMLFVHWPLLIDHGLRTNNMEGSLFLCYCGGVYHLLGWARTTTTRRIWHALAAGLYFVLGFMTKFVAALFLPAVLGLAVLMFRSTRARLAADWRLWAFVAGLAVALIGPWFVYAQVQFGALLWHIMLAEHVFVRFTTALSQTHVHPWSYYFIRMAEEFSRSGLAWLVPLGLVVLLVQTVRRRWFEGAVVFLWATVPIALISVGSSKLYHYAYPFLPPLAIAAGYVVALAWMLAPVLVRKILAGAEDLIARFAPPVGALASRRWIWTSGTVVIWLATFMIVAALAFGQVKVGIGRTVLFKSSRMLRPLAVIILAGVLTRRSARVAPLVVGLTIAWWMPVPVYEDTVRELLVQRHPLRDVSECIRRVEANVGAGTPPGLYVDTDSSMWHPIYYYFRRIQPWTRQETPSPERLERELHDTTSMRPSLVQELRYRDYMHGPTAVRPNQGISPPLVSLLEYELLLPGPYGVCSPEAALHASP
jgi:4-amino-4-deoxy-L-arabinose transferase-like glycosyltransferase